MSEESEALLAADPPPEGPPSSPPARASRLELGARIVLPVCGALALATYLTASGARIDEELHLIAPPRAVPGQPIPVRAHLYTDLEAIEGARLAQLPVRAVLLGDDGAQLSRVTLRPGLGGSMEAELHVPVAAAGRKHVLQLQAQREERSVDVRAALGTGAQARREEPAPRPLRALQGMALAEVEAIGDARAPELGLRVAGGVCVPETPCVLYVHMGEPASALRVEPSASTELVTAPPVVESSGVLPARVVVHGPEGYLTLEAFRAGQKVARRRVRLPLALGAGALTLTSRLLDAPARPRLSLGPDAGPCLIDAWREGLWLRSATATECAVLADAPFSPLGPGLWRLQARRDPFGTDAAGVAVVHVGEPGQSAAEKLHVIAQAARQRAPDDAFAREVLAAPEVSVANMEPSAGYLLAVLEEGLMPQPAPHSSLPAARARLAAERATLRGAALWVLALSGLALVLVVVRRGLDATARAGRLMRDAGESSSELSRHRLRRLANVALVATLLALAFVAIALYLRARG